MSVLVLYVVGAVWATILVAAIVPALRTPTERHLVAFAELYDVRLGPAAARLVSEALAWTRRWRVVGGVVGALAWWVWSRESAPLNPFAIAAGMAMGSVLAEITRAPIHTGPLRAASTRRRSVTDHVQRFVVVGWLAFCAMALSIIVAAAAFMNTPNGIATSDLVIGVGALTLGTSVWPIAGAVARRPSPQQDAETAAAVHALRTASIGSVIGGGTVVMGVGTYRVAFAVVLVDSDMPALIRHLDNAAMLTSIAAIFIGIGFVFGSYPRRPERRPRQVAS